MSYPFANNNYAQSSSNGHVHQSYRDPYAHDASYGQGVTSPTRYEHDNGEYAGRPENSYYNRPDATQDNAAYGAPYGHTGLSHDDDVYPSPPPHEKMLNEGRSPYDNSTDMLTASPYNSNHNKGDSIWTADRKRVMGRRSVAAKIFRVSFCVIINTIIVILSIVCLVIIFARPPMVGIGTVNTPNASDVGVSGSTLTVNGSVNFIISNPNSISATLSSVTANVYDKVDTSQAIGSGSLSNQKIEPHSNTTIAFPFQIEYDPTADSNSAILKDLATKCGLTGGSSQDLDLVLKVDSRLKILSVPIPIAFSQDISFTCPLSSSILRELGAGSLSSLFKRAGGEAAQKRWYDVVGMDRRIEL